MLIREQRTLNTIFHRERTTMVRDAVARCVAVCCSPLPPCNEGGHIASLVSVWACDGDTQTLEDRADHRLRRVLDRKEDAVRALRDAIRRIAAVRAETAELQVTTERTVVRATQPSVAWPCVALCGGARLVHDG